MFKWLIVGTVAYSLGRASGKDSAKCPDGSRPRRVSDYVGQARTFCDQTLPQIESAVETGERLGILGMGACAPCSRRRR